MGLKIKPSYKLARRCASFACLAALFFSFGLALPVHAGLLLAAGGKADITPDIAHETTWLAGYGPDGRRARGVHDPLFARATVISDGNKTVALVSVDSIGIFREDVLSIRNALGWDGTSHYLFLAATHDHSAPDTMGLWGRYPGFSGVNAQYHQKLLRTIVDLVKSVSGNMHEVMMDAASATINPNHLCRDSRDPVVIDPELQAVQLISKSKGTFGRTIATVVRWSCHAEVMSSKNLLLTADYPGALCRRIEERNGGTCVFFNGVIGGLLTPDSDVKDGTDQEFSEAERIGDQIAEYALLALDSSSEHYFSGKVSFDSRVVRVPVENSRYLLFLRSLTFGHRLLDRDGRPLPRRAAWLLPLKHLFSFPLPDSERPWVETEVSLVRVGPLSVVGIPGELFPELAIGGYDGRYRFGHPLIQPSNANPPDLSKAPKGPYLRDKVHSGHVMLVGLANDELGYIIPSYDFVVTPTRTMLPKPKGHHYEETNSIGPSVTPILMRAYDDLLGNPLLSASSLAGNAAK